MTNRTLLSRRTFLQNLAIGAGLSLLPTSTLFASQFRIKSDLLNFRQNAPLLKLHYNENSLGMSKKALLAAQESILLYGNRYPDEAVDALKQQIAIENQIPSNQLVLGNGSTEVLGTVVAYAASIGATLLEPSPTFGDVRSRAVARNMKVIQVDSGNEFRTQIDRLDKAAKKINGPILINLCNPNNPTGTIVNKKELFHWILSAPDSYIFLIDEAYHEYALTNPDYSSVLPLIKKGRENLVLTRTFSKIYGMAGMRVGYGIAAPNTANKLDLLAASFNLSAAGVASASASLSDRTFFDKSVASNEQAKKILIDTLKELNLSYIPSNTNFVLHEIKSDLMTYSQRMLANNIKVGRKMTNEDGWNRLSLGTPEEMKYFVRTLKAFRERGWV